MTDGELISAAITVIGGGLGGTLKWAVGRITKAIDDNSEIIKAETAAKISLAEKLGAFGAKVEAVSDWIERHPTPVRGVPVTAAPATRQTNEPVPRASTQGGGSYHVGSAPKRRP